MSLNKKPNASDKKRPLSQRLSSNSPRQSGFSLSGLTPRNVPGKLHTENSQAGDWNWNGLFAYGCQCLVVVVDPETLITVQTLIRHRAFVTTCKWQPQIKVKEQEPDENNGNSKNIDEEVNNKIYIPEPPINNRRKSRGKNKEEFIRRRSYVNNNCKNFPLRLATGDASGTICIFDVAQGKCLKSVFFGKKVLSIEWHNRKPDFLLTLHDPPTICLWDNQSLVFKKEFSEPVTCFALDPFSHLSIAIITGQFVRFLNDFSEGDSQQESEKYNVKRLSLTENLISRSSSSMLKSSSKTGLVDLNALPVQIVYSLSSSDRLFIVFPREIVHFDIKIKEAISHLKLEKGGSQFVKILPTKSASGLVFTCHQNGCISSYIEVNGVYKLRCQSENLRFGKLNPLSTALLDPVNENSICLIASNGKLLKWEYCQSYIDKHDGRYSLRIVDTKKHIWHTKQLSWDDDHKEKDQGKFKFVLKGVNERITQQMSCFAFFYDPQLQIAEENTDSFLDSHIRAHPYVAVGKENGRVQIIDMKSTQVIREIEAHNVPIAGIEWIQLDYMYTYASDSVDKGKFRNCIKAIDMKTGRVRVVRPDKYLESGAIKDMEISATHRYALLIFTGSIKPLELWDMSKTAVILRDIPQFLNVSAIAWWKRRMLHNDPQDGSEKFAIALNDGRIHLYTVEGKTIKAGLILDQTGTVGEISCLAWQNNCILSGDSSGNIHIWKINNEITARAHPTSHSTVLSVCFCQSVPSKALLLFNDGMEIWDTENMTRLSGAEGRRSGDGEERLEMQGIGWLDIMPVVACSDNSIRVVDPQIRGSTSTMLDILPPNLLWCPSIVDEDVALHVKSLLQHNYKVDFRVTDANCKFQNVVKQQYNIIKKRFDPKLSKSDNMPRRCMVVAEIFGDKYEYEFWELASYYLPKGIVKQASRDDTLHMSLAFSNVKHLVEDTESIGLPSLPAARNRKLSTSYGVLGDNDDVRETLLSKTRMRTKSSASSDVVRRCVTDQVCYGDYDSAKSIFLETDGQDEKFKESTLKACLIASMQSPEQREETMFMAAVSMMGTGNIDDGVMLLCLLDKHAIACNYLQNYGQWERAAELAKAMLIPEECAVVLQRWVEHLCTDKTNDKFKAVFLQLSLGQFNEVIDLLFEIEYYDLAVLFYEACQEKNIALDVPDVVLGDMFYTYSEYLQSIQMSSIAKVYKEKSLNFESKHDEDITTTTATGRKMKNHLNDIEYDS